MSIKTLKLFFLSVSINVEWLPIPEKAMKLSFKSKSSLFVIEYLESKISQNSFKFYNIMEFSFILSSLPFKK